MSRVLPLARSGYVRVVHGLGAVLAALGVLGLLERRAVHSRTALWVRSWFAVHDLDQMVRLGVPWWTFEASDAVAEFLEHHPDARVFEWGSGASTVWLGARSGTVASVEHDPDWAARMADVLPLNAALLLVEPDAGAPGGTATPTTPSAKAGFAGLDFTAYVARIDDVRGELDLIVIDGRAREACLDRAVERLAHGGLIVVDNVERARYRAAIARHPGLDVRWTRGRTPALPYPTQTALLTRGAR